MSGPRLIPVQRCTNLRQWKAMRQLHGRYAEPVMRVTRRREPSRTGLLVASVLCILAALISFYFLLEAGIPAGVGR